MNTQDRAKQAIPLLQAIVEGKTLQCRVGVSSWVDCSPGEWLLVEVMKESDAFRIKTIPVPAREWWVSEYPNGAFGPLYQTRSGAEQAAEIFHCKTVHVIEAP
jgi:hypothetical protein